MDADMFILNNKICTYTFMNKQMPKELDDQQSYVQSYQILN